MTVAEERMFDRQSLVGMLIGMAEIFGELSETEEAVDAMMAKLDQYLPILSPAAQAAEMLEMEFLQEAQGSC